MRSLNPAIKFVSLLIPTFFLAAKPDPLINFAVFLLCLLLTVVSKVKAKTLIGLYIPIFIMAFGMFMTGFKFTSAEALPINAAALNIGSFALWNGLIFSSRVLAYASLGLLFALTTDKIEMIHSFAKQFHLPQIFAYGLLAAWGVFPHMAEEYRRSRSAFNARGEHPMAFSPALLRPLLVKSVQWSEELSIAMESKGFDSNAKRTQFNPPQIHFRDIMFFMVSAAAIPILILFFAK
jgi:energy-coupling factor transporter transmembrane protein EcfT